MPPNLFFRPVETAFDVAAIRHHLDGQPDAFADPHGTDYYIVCGAPEAVQFFWEKRFKDSTRFPYTCLVQVNAEQVIIEQEYADEQAMRSALALAKWLWDGFPCTVHDERRNDLTERVRSEGIASLYPEWVKNVPIPWADKLIKIGFFQELDHGDTNAPSLEESRASTPDVDEDRILTYLEKGHLFRSSTDVAEDWLAEDPDVVIGPPHILTDGKYAWPADLPYYVRNYHVRLPKHFLIHIQSNGYQIPADVDISGLKLE